MSDGLTEVSRDEERTEMRNEYFNSLTKFLKDSSIDNYHFLQQSAEDADSIRGGYWTGKTSLAKNLNKRLILLEEGDKKTWLRLLISLNEDEEIYNELKELSPFSEKDISYIDYGCGFVVESRSKGSLMGMIHSELRRRKIPIFGGEDYAIVLPDKNIEEMKRLFKDAEIYDLTTRIRVVD